MLFQISFLFLSPFFSLAAELSPPYSRMEPVTYVPQPKQVSSLSEVIIDHDPELLFSDHRFMHWWNHKGSLAYILGSLLSKHIDLTLRIDLALSAHGEDKKVYMDASKFFNFLNDVSLTIYENNPRKMVLRHFVNRFFDMQTLRVEFKDKTQMRCHDVQTILVRSSRTVYPAVTFSIAILKSLAIGSVKEKTEVLELLDLLVMHPMFALLHFPILKDYVRPHLINIVLHFVRIGDAIRFRARSSILMCLTVLPDSELVKQVIIEEYLPVIPPNYLPIMLFSLGPLCSPAVLVKLNALIAEKKPESDLFNASRFLEAFRPVLSFGSITFLFEVNNTNDLKLLFEYGHFCNLPYVDGQPLSQSFPNSDYYLYYECKSQIMNLGAAELAARPTRLFLYHDLPLSDEFKELLREWVDGNRVQEPEFYFRVAASGVSIFKSKGFVF